MSDFSKDFLDRTQKVCRKRNDKLDIIKIKYRCSLKETTKKMKRQATDWEKISAKHISDRGLYPGYIKNSYNSIRRRQVI